MIQDHRTRRSTRQKKMVLDAIMNSDCHPSAGELHAMLADTKIGVATVYRQLSSLVNDGIIKSFEHNGEVRYDPITKPHAHIVCPICNVIWDVELPKEIKSLAPMNDSFEEFEVDLTWKGICSKCR